jgi:glycosyltransferase involved in cell wall biosynthesis
VRCPGFVSTPWAWFGHARLLVLPSRWEGFANVVAEALACGVPTLVTDCDYGPSEIVEHGSSGWIVRRGSAAALQTAMDRILTDQPLAQSLAEGARERAMVFNIDQVVSEYADLFLDQVMERRAATAGAAELAFAQA